MPLRLRRLRASLLTVLLASFLTFLPVVARATYTGVQDATTLGTVAAGENWIVVPQYEDSYDPGLIDGTPYNNTTSSLEVSRVSGPRHISFRSVQARYSLTMGPMLVAGAHNVLAVAWADAAGAGQINNATLSAHGNLPDPLTQTGVPTDDSLRLSAGPDGAYAVSWRDGIGAHIMAAPAGAQRLTAMLGPDVPLDPVDHVMLSGGDSFWLVNDAGGSLSAAPAVFGQDTAPHALTVSDAVHATTLGDDAGGLWALARSNRGWFAAHVDRAGQLSSTPLPAGTTHAVIALAGTTAVIAYRAAPHCATYIERLRSTATPHTPIGRTNLTPRAAACSTPTGIAVDPASATAYVLMHSSDGTTLTTETTTRNTSSWRGSLTGRVDAIVAGESNRVVVESNGPQRNIGEQCGGANPSSSQSYFFRVFHRAHLERSGQLDASVLNC
jgi:DNA-binding beta-propeller fold protein YncE